MTRIRTLHPDEVKRRLKAIGFRELGNLVKYRDLYLGRADSPDATEAWDLAYQWSREPHVLKETMAAKIVFIAGRKAHYGGGLIYEWARVLDDARTVPPEQAVDDIFWR